MTTRTDGDDGAARRRLLSARFERDRALHDCRRVGYIALVSVALHVVIGEVVFARAGWAAANESFRAGVQRAHRVDLAVMLAVTLPLAYAATRGGARYALRRIVPLLLAFQALLVGAWLGVNSQQLNGNVNVFVFLSIVVAAALRLPALDAAAVFGLCTTLAAVGIARAQADVAVRFASITNVVGAALFGFVVAWLNRSNARQQFELGAQLQEKNEELEKSRAAMVELNGSLERRVDEQVREIVENAEEIKRLNAVLRQSVVEQARQLRRALTGIRSTDEVEVATGSVIDGRVELLSPLGAGGSSDVFLAYDRKLDRRVVIKLLRASARSSKSTLERFVSEAELASRVEHPAVIAPIHVGVSEGGRFYHLFEFVDGVVLSEVQKQCGFSPDEVLRLVAGVASALAAAHESGVIHRDVKPSNILVSAKRPGVFVLDFGIAKLDTPDESHQGLTEEGELLGTPLFMAPEQVIEPESVRPSADVYALGLVWLELLQGVARVDGLTRIAVALRRLRDPSPRLRESFGYAPAVVALFEAMTSADPALRPTAARVAEVLAAEADRMGVGPAEAFVLQRGCGTSCHDCEPAVLAQKASGQ